METLTSSVSDILPSADAMKSAFESRNWLLLGGMVLMVVVVMIRRMGLLDKLAPELHQWAAMGLAMAGAVAGGIMMGMSWLSIIPTGLLTGLAAIGGWETLGRMLFAKKAP